jgi:CubicO group peptidase (beta-lactamase class C family)
LGEFVNVKNSTIRKLEWALLLGAAATLASASATSAPDGAALSASVDAVVQRQMKDQKIPGLSLAVVRDGVVIKAKGYGFSNLELGTSTRVDTVFPAASITKQFIAAVIMQLVEQGKLGLDDSITKYFPEAPVAWKTITIRHLLTHTSGIPDIVDEPEVNPPHKTILDFRRDYTEDELARGYTAQPLDFEPGTKMSYCNTGYQLLGILIHRVTGAYYGDYLREHIFAPLGMSTTTIFSSKNIVPNRASGYEVSDGKWKNLRSWQSDSVVAGADGGLLVSVLDLAKWDAALNTEHILKRSSLGVMWTPVPLDDGSGSAYRGGMGWYIANAHGHRIVFHTGGTFGFYAVNLRYLDDRLAVVVMTNIDEHHADVLKIAGDVAAIYLPDTKGANPVKDWQD